MNDTKMVIPYVIAVDFDGTLFERKWPLIGAPNLELIRHLKNEQNDGSRIILWTCRTGEMLEQAVKACKQFGLIFDAVNDNIPEIKAIYGNDSRKITACEYIDDLMSTKFVLPFVEKKGITDEVLTRIEQAFSFPLYDWQREYLKGDDSAFPKSGRGNGKTFAHCVRLLLGEREPIDLRNVLEIDNLVDNPGGKRYFRDYISRINDILVENGFETNAKTYCEKGLSVTDDDIKIIERLITSDGNSVNFKDIKALTKMNYDIYKRLMNPVKIL